MNIEAYNMYNVKGKKILDNIDILKALDTFTEDDDPESFAVTRVSQSCGTNHTIPNFPVDITLGSAEYLNGKLYVCGGEQSQRTYTSSKNTVSI